MIKTVDAIYLFWNKKEKLLVIFLAKQSTRDSPSKSLDHISLVDVYYIVYSTKRPPDPFNLIILPQIIQDDCHVDQNSNFIFYCSKLLYFGIFKRKKLNLGMHRTCIQTDNRAGMQLHSRCIFNVCLECQRKWHITWILSCILVKWYIYLLEEHII